MTRNPWFPDAHPRVITQAEACQKDFAGLEEAITALGEVRRAQHSERFAAFTATGDRYDVLARWNRINDRLDDACAVVEVCAERLALSLAQFLPREKPQFH